MEELKEKHFNPKAHILTLLGNELIKSPVMAIYELVKNSYDADAKKVTVRFADIEDITKAVIIIEDDGLGMTSEIIEDVWLEPGSDFRKPINKITGLRDINKSPIYNRVPMGEKGVGRFAVHKLGHEILVISRPKIIIFEEDSKIIKSVQLADYEIQLFINWRDFSQSKHLSDVPIQWKIKRDVNSFRFKEDSGTYIRLGSLKESWTKGMARELKGQVISMLSPRMNEDDFKIHLRFDNQWLVDFPSAKTILENAPYTIIALIDSKYNLTFEYNFHLQNNSEIGSREIKNNPKHDLNIKGRIRAELRKRYEDQEISKKDVERILQEFDKKDLPFGDVMLEFYSFDLDPVSKRDYALDSKLVGDILKLHSGIKVFKGDLRVYDYGEPNNDWLGLDLERVNNKEWFSNNQNIGYIYLDAEKSGTLIEKTNREGFIQNDAFNLFFEIIMSIMREIKAERQIDRIKWLNYNKKSSERLFDDKVKSFKYLLEETDLNNDEKKKKLFEEAEKLEEKYEEDRQTLLIPAGVGMTASVALHEIEKLIPRLEETARSKPIKQEILIDQVKELKQYSEGILSVLRKGGGKPMNVEEGLKRAYNNNRYRFEDRNVKASINVDADVDTINCDNRFFITMIMNLLDNSIYWLDTIYKNDKEVYIQALKIENAIVVIVADNGPGFKDPISEIIRPFFTRKSRGIGIGMYLIDTIMMKYGKLDIISDPSELVLYKIPERMTGAVVKLVFNKKRSYDII